MLEACFGVLESAYRRHLDIQNILDELREQRDHVAALIEVLERISFEQTPRRAAPPSG
jgi:hypothetical protein